MSSRWDRRPGPEQERIAGLLLADWLPAVAAFSPYWSQRAASLGYDPDELDGPAVMQRLGPVREHDLVGAGGTGAPALVLQPDREQATARAGGGWMRAVARSLGFGPTGERWGVLADYKPLHLHRAGVSRELMIAYTRSDLDRLHRCGARAAAVLGLGTNSYLVSAVPPGPRLAFWGLYHLALGSSMLALHPRGADGGLEDVLASLSLVPATAVAVPVGEAGRLAAAVARRGVACGQVGTVVTLGPPPDDATRHELAEAWEQVVGGPVAVRALWAPSEARALWAECQAGGHGLHTFPDLEVLEVLDPVTREPTDGAGDLTYTSAGWNGTGLVRYQTGSWVEGLVDEPCPGCGRTVPRLVGEVVEGAWQARIDVGGELVVVDLRGAAAVLGPCEQVEAWRVELTTGRRGDRVHVRLAGASPALIDELSDELTEAIGVRPAEIEEVGDPTVVEAEVRELGGVFVDLR